MSTHEQHVIDAVMYALKVGCLHPVRFPKRKTSGYVTGELIKWGAMRYLHTAIAEFDRRRRR